MYLAGVPISAEAASREKEGQTPIVIPKADPKNPDQIGNLSYEVAVKRALEAKGDARKGRLLFDNQSCRAVRPS